jgi:hypothetical protein
VNFGERGKSSGRQLWTLGVKWGLTKSLTMGWPTSVSTSQKGSIELVGKFFKVRAQVDRDLTTVSWVDQLLGLIKNLGRHMLFNKLNVINYNLCTLLLLKYGMINPHMK